MKQTVDLCELKTTVDPVTGSTQSGGKVSASARGEEESWLSDCVL